MVVLSGKTGPQQGMLESTGLLRGRRVSTRVHAWGTATRSLTLDSCPWPPKPRVDRWSVLKHPAYHGLLATWAVLLALGPEVPSFRRFRGRKLFKEDHLK